LSSTTTSRPSDARAGDDGASTVGDAYLGLEHDQRDGAAVELS